jgi:hypothetical protein
MTRTIKSGPITSFDEEVCVSDNGFEYYIAYTDDVLTEDTLIAGQKIAVKATTVDKHGMDNLIGKCVVRRERVTS